MFPSTYPMTEEGISDHLEAAEESTSHIQFPQPPPTHAHLDPVELQNIHRNLTAVNQSWQKRNITHILELFECTNSAAKLKELSMKELCVLVSSTESYQIKQGKLIPKSWSKIKKANALSELFGDKSQLQLGNKPKSLKMLSLCDITFAAVCKFPKPVLNAIYAVFSYQEHHAMWIQDSPVGAVMEIKGIVEENEWFSYPEVHQQTGQPVVKCIDGHHLFVKICKDGVQGVKKDAWHQVAEHDSSIISKSLVVDLLDKQRNSYAKRTFSADVEHTMRGSGYEKEADFTRIVREWYAAEDDRAIPALQRTKQRLAFRHFILKDVSFASFPPHGMYIKGFPQVMYEGFVSSIDSHTQLYTLCRRRTYNQRAFNSLENETFFGSLTDMDPTKLGCPRAVNINRLMAMVTEVMHYRQDPECR